MLWTKLHIPQPKENVIPRYSLFEKLNEGLDRKLILVSATAGYGKTTLLSDWLRKSEIPTAWFSIDHRDNDPIEFLTFLISGVQTIHKDFGKHSSELLKSPGTVSFQYIIELLINDILAVKSDLLLVLDDLHTIHDKDILNSIELIIARKPEHFKIAILTRSDPPLPLARLRSQNELMEIRSTDLCFTENDIAEFFNRKLKLGLSNEDINIIETKTEGWIAGLQLAAISMQGKENISDFIKGIAGYNRYIMDYLMEEVLINQDEETRNFLLHTSILEKFSGSLCNAILQIDHSQLLLESLDKSNLFMVSLDDERKWFRYHHLFRDLLQQRLIATEKEYIPELHNKASIWFEANDMPLFAIEHALAAGNRQKGLSLIEEIIDYLVETSQYSLIIKYAELFPEEDVFSNIKFGIMHAWTLIIVGRLPEAEEFLTKINAIIKSEEVRNRNKALLGRLYTTHTLLKDYMGQVEGALHYSDLSIKYMNEDDIVWNSWTFYGKALSDLLRFDLDASISSLSSGLDYAEQVNNTYLEIVHTIHIAYFLRLKGRYQESINICNGLLDKYKAKSHAEGFKLNLYSSILYSTIGLMMVEQGKIKSGIELAMKGFKLSQNLLSISFKGYGVLLLAETYFKAGEPETALEILAMQYTRLLDNNRHWLSVLSYALKLKLLSRMGQQEKADELHKHLIKSGDLHGLEHYMYSISTAHFFISAARYDEALVLLEELSTALKEKQVLELFVEVELMKTKIFMLSSREEDALNCILNSLAKTQDEGFIRIYINEGEDLERIIKEIKREKSTRSSPLLDTISNDYLSDLINAFSKEDTNKRHRKEEVLSKRELNILNLIAEDYTNQEIANELYISLATVKTHVRNILLKLEVNNRQEAAAKAREKQII